jgi:hypothetical protein
MGTLMVMEGGGVGVGVDGDVQTTTVHNSHIEVETVAIVQIERLFERSRG